MNDIQQWWAIVKRQSWTFHDLIGQGSPLPVADGGTGTSTVALLTSTLGLSSMAYQASSNVAITGGSATGLSNVSTATVSTGTVYAGSLAATGQVSFSAVTTITNAHSPYTVLPIDRFIRCNASSGSITVLMPHASTAIRDIFVKKVDSGVSTVTISSVATDTFDGKVTTQIASQYGVKAFINGTSSNWDRLNVNTL